MRRRRADSGSQRSIEAPDGGQREGRPMAPLACSSIETQNVSWKLALPAYSGSTPIIWGDTIFLNVATGHNAGDARALGDRSQQADGDVEAADRRRQPHGAQAEHVVALAGDRRPHRLGDDRRRRPQGVRLRRQGTLVARHADRLRPLRPQLGLRVVAAAARRRALRAGAARHEDRRPVLRAAHRQGDGQDDVEGRAADATRTTSRRTRTRRRRCCSTTARPRSSSPAATSSPVTIRRPARNSGAPTCSTRRTTRDYRIVASPTVVGGSDHRAEPQQPAGRDQAGRPRRHLDEPHRVGSSIADRTCRRR